MQPLAHTDHIWLTSSTFNTVATTIGTLILALLALIAVLFTYRQIRIRRRERQEDRTYAYLDAYSDEKFVACARRAMAVLNGEPEILANGVTPPSRSPLPTTTRAACRKWWDELTKTDQNAVMAYCNFWITLGSLVEQGRVDYKLTKLNFEPVSRKSFDRLSLLIKMLRRYEDWPLQEGFAREWGAMVDRFAGGPWIGRADPIPGEVLRCEVPSEVSWRPSWWRRPLYVVTRQWYRRPVPLRDRPQWYRRPVAWTKIDGATGRSLKLRKEWVNDEVSCEVRVLNGLTGWVGDPTANHRSPWVEVVPSRRENRA